MIISMIKAWADLLTQDDGIIKVDINYRDKISIRLLTSSVALLIITFKPRHLSLCADC